MEKYEFLQICGFDMSFVMVKESKVHVFPMRLIARAEENTVPLPSLSKPMCPQLRLSLFYLFGFGEEFLYLFYKFVFEVEGFHRVRYVVHVIFR